MRFILSASIVLYKNDKDELIRTIRSFLNTSISIHLYLIDNSPSPLLEEIIDDNRVTYLFLNSNRGFGAGHNVILKRPHLMGKYHLVLNPDIEFAAGTLESLVEFMDKHTDVGNVMPKVVYPNGDLQYLCKLLPTPLNWIFRIAMPIKSVRDRLDYDFEMRFADYNKEMNVPYLSGCFMFLRRSVIEEIGVFDEGIFMYGEDTDLNRRIYSKYRTMYYPKVQITHNFEKGSHKSIRLLWIHVKAAVYYMNKWGWLFDSDRKKINTNTKNRYSVVKS